MKRKRILILGAAVALTISGCASAVSAKRNVVLKEGEQVSETLAFHFSGSSVHGSESSYDAREADVNSSSASKIASAHWQITVGNNSAQLGTNAKNGNLSKATLGNGGFTAASGLASALSIQTTTQKYSAAICTTGMENITKGELIFTGTNGGNITTAWLLSSTNGTSWTIEDSKTSSITTGTVFTVDKSSDAKQFAFVAYWNLTNSGGLKGFEFKLYGEYADFVQTYGVTYNGNGNTGGEVPTDDTEYEYGDEIIVLGNAGNLVKTGYEFAGWSNGQTVYQPGDSISVTSNVVLTAVWNYLTHYTEDTSASTITWNLTKPEYISATDSEVSWNSPKATMVAEKGTATTSPNNYCPPAQNSTRFYKNSILTITPANGYKINSVVFTATTDNYATALGNSDWTNAVATVDSATVTVVPTVKNSAISANIGDTTGHTSVVVNYVVDTGDIPAEDIELDNHQLSLVSGTDHTLTATLTPADSTDVVKWSSSNETVATVNSNGKVVAVAAGEATIVAFIDNVIENNQYDSGELNDNCVVTVTPAPGSTVDNPYTVAQARAAIDAGTGINGVYAVGIVSKIVTEYSSQYGNISYNISDDGSEDSDQLQAFRGKNKGGVNFTSADDVQVGDKVVVYGNLKKYNSTYEFDAGNQLIKKIVEGKLDTPDPKYNGTQITWEPIEYASSYDISIDGGETIHNVVSPYTLGELTAPAAHIVKVTAIGNGSYDDSDEASLTIASLTKAGTVSNPFDIVNARLAIVDTTGRFDLSSVYVAGIISQIDSYDNTHKSITYWISDDGSTTSEQFEVYSGKGLNGVEFNSIDEIEVGASVVITGSIKAYGGVYEFNYNNHLVSYSAPAHELNYYLNKASIYAELSGNENYNTGESVTITKLISEVSGTTTNETQVDSLPLDSVITVSTNADGNNGKVYNDGAEWRLYQTDSAVVTVSAESGYIITSVKFTYTVKNTGTLYCGDSVVESESSVSTYSNSVQFVVGNSASATNGQVKVSEISVTYNQSTFESVDGVAMRLGVRFDKSIWDDMAANFTIKDYGVMLFKRLADSAEPTLTVEEAFEDGRTLATVRKGSGAAPYLDENINQYVFNAKVKISSSNYNLVIASAAFIVIENELGEDEYHFIAIDDYSAKTLATYHLTNGGTSLSETALRAIING